MKLKTPFEDAIMKSTPQAGEGSWSGSQMSDLPGGDDLGVDAVQFHEVAPPPKDVKEINPNVFGMKLGKSTRG